MGIMEEQPCLSQPADLCGICLGARLKHNEMFNGECGNYFYEGSKLPQIQGCPKMKEKCLLLDGIHPNQSLTCFDGLDH